MVPVALLLALVVTSMGTSSTGNASAMLARLPMQTVVIKACILVCSRRWLDAIADGYNGVMFLVSMVLFVARMQECDGEEQEWYCTVTQRAETSVWG